MQLLGSFIAVSAAPILWSQPLPDLSPGASSARELLAAMREELIAVRATIEALEVRVAQPQSRRSGETLPAAESIE